MSRLILLALALALAWWGIRTARSLLRAVPARKDARARFFSRADGLLAGRVQRLEPTGFPRLAGNYAGLRFDLQAVPDTLTFRKLPALWVMVTLTEPQALTGETHIMARTSGLESFSRIDTMRFDLGAPPGFPPECVLRCTNPASIPAPEVMARLAPLFGDPRLKEAVLSPKGLRLVTLAEEADRTSYLIFRDAELGAQPFPTERLKQMLTDLADLHRPPKAPE